jgi:hypothetical protein
MQTRTARAIEVNRPGEPRFKKIVTSLAPKSAVVPTSHDDVSLRAV